jgi:hypothetical protein
MTNKFSEDKRLFLWLFIKLEVYCFLVSGVLGLAGWFAHDWFVGLKLLLGCFVFVQPFLFYSYKDVWRSVIGRR